jgi:hypothetical protein
MLDRRTLIGGLGASSIAAACGANEASWRRAGREATERGVTWLVSQQADGSFPSRTYGLLASGQSLTPFVVGALLDAGMAPDRGEVRAALAWIAARVDSVGALGFATAIPDYPCYATALAVSCLVRAQPPGWSDLAGRLATWLDGQQYGPAWDGHPARGGFGMGARLSPTPPDAGHVDLSMTRRAVEAFAAIGRPPDHPSMQAARTFVERSQTEAGGFLYSPVELMLNKGRRTGDTPQAYGSATADGLLALLALGATAADPRVARAHAFLLDIHRFDENPGVAGGPMDAFAKAMTGYYRAGSSAVFRALGGPDGWQAAMAAAVVAEQRPDGAWANRSALQKEDDPIIATGFALQALGLVLH